MRSPSLTVLLAGLALVACVPEAEEAGDAESSEGTAQKAGTAQAPHTPDTISETAWLARAEDGTRFVTYFDADGTYRDMRNGDFLQAGTWTYADGPGGKQICLKPLDENAVKMCWLPDTMDGKVMTAIGPEGRRIELQRMDYVAPDAEGSDAGE